jgi:hypothetical protein
MPGGSRFCLPQTGRPCTQALALGAVPVVEKSSISDELFQDQSVLVVDNLEDVTEEMLLKFMQRTSAHRRERVFAAFWMTELRKTQLSIIAQEKLAMER